MDWLKDEIGGIKEGIREITEHLEHVDKKLVIDV
jgi:archaellum component FlaC